VETLHDKVVVITGGASGIGRGLADRFATAGARIVLADVEEPALTRAVNELTVAGAEVIGVQVDVSVEAEVKELLSRALDAYGTVNVACLNAGVGGGGGPLHTLSAADWQWTLGVNLWGIIHGVRAFVPHLVSHGDGHVVVTASIAGLTSYPWMGPYTTSKHAAVAIAETLFAELREAGSTVGVTCLCPGIVRTRLPDSARNRPAGLRNPQGPSTFTGEQLAVKQFADEVHAQAMGPAEVAQLVHEAILARRFWVFTDEVYTPEIQARLDGIRNRTDPTTRGSLLDVYRT
jgi:NAD(P)-dependent dehydrogenase (short-subunit alcohol dehydrogenase family)